LGSRLWLQAGRTRGPDVGRADRGHCSDRGVVGRRLCYGNRTMSFDESHGSPLKDRSMRTPLGRVRALGSSHSGTSDFWRQRITAVGLVILIVPVIVVVMMLRERNQAYAAQILGSPAVAIVMLLFIIASAWHMKIGMQVVI